MIDYDGDGRTDYSVLRFPDIDPPAVAAIDWWNFNSYVGSQTYNGFGDANRDFPAPGDYDGDGRTDIAIFRSGAVATYWIVRSTTNTLQVIEWGTTGDQTIQRDYDGDGRTDPAVFRFGALATDPTTWLIRNSSNGTARIEQFGLSGNGTTSSDFAVPGDYDGDGKFDLAVYRFGQAPANNWIVKRSSDGVVTYQPFGNFNTDYILPGDYDGDGKYDYAAARTGSTSTSPMTWWYIRSSSGSTHTQVFGRSSDLPAQGDYDGDGRTDIAIYRPGATALAQSSYWVSRSFDLGAHQTIWGLGADFSVNTYDIR